MKALHKYVLAILFFVFSLNGKAQEFPWNAYFGSNGADFATDIRQTTDNGYIISGYGADGNSGNYYVVKIDMFGNLQWQRNLNKDNYSEKAYSILETADQKFIVIGVATSGNKPWIVKLDTNGETIWTSAWTDNPDLNSALLARGVLLSDQRIVVIGAQGYYGAQPNMFIVSPEGELLEQKILNAIVPPGYLAGTFVNHIESTSDGGFILTGSAGSGTSSRAFLWKFDQNADSSWTAHFTGQNAWMRIAESVKQLSDGGFILSGSIGPNTNASCAIRTDAQGNLMWFQSYPDSIYTQATDVIEWQNGQFLITEKRFEGVGTPFYQSALLTIDGAGTLINRSMIMASDSSTTITSMRNTNDGGFVMAGEINEYFWMNEQDLFVLKSDALGNIAGATLDYVWPGDVNYDGVVNMDDLLLLGVTAGASGPLRVNASIEWLPQYVTDWADTVVSGVNYKHADTDGNGIVDIMDTLAISANYGLSRIVVKNSLSLPSGNDLFITNEELVVSEGKYVQIPVRLGSTNNVINSIYGMRFSIETSPELIKTESIAIDFSQSWLGQHNMNLWAAKKVIENEHTVDFGLTLNNHQPVSGFGVIGMLTFTLQESLDPGASLNTDISFKNFKATNIDLENLDLYSGTFEIIIANTVTSNPAMKDEHPQKVSPNPVSKGNFVKISNMSGIDKVEVVNIHGIRISKIFAGDQHEIHFAAPDTPGTYFVRLHSTRGDVSIQKIIVL